MTNKVIQADEATTDAISVFCGPGMDFDEVNRLVAQHRISSISPYIEREAKLIEALEPILHWYQSDVQAPRDLVDILHDVVADLQSDRRAALKVRVAAEALRPFANASDRAKEKAVRMEELGMGCASQNTTGTWGVQASDLHQAKETLTQIDTLLEGGEA